MRRVDTTEPHFRRLRMEGMQQKIFESRVDAYVPAPIVEYLNSGVPMNEQIDERHKFWHSVVVYW